MRVRWLGLLLALAVVGAAAGYGVGVLRQQEPTSFAATRPVPATSPSIPVDVPSPYADDIAYPALEPGLDYRQRRIGTAPYAWTFDVPTGWVVVWQALNERRWRPVGEPSVGGYSLRVKLVTEHKTPEQMVAQKRAAVTSIYDDVQVIEQTDDRLSFIYREPSTNTKRYDLFQWLTAPGGTEADFEMSVVGRSADVPGLEDLLEHVASSVRKVP